MEGPLARLTCYQHVKDGRRVNRSLNGTSCGVEHADTEVKVVFRTHKTIGVVDQNSVVYHDAADTNPQIDVSVPWTTANKVLKLQRKVQNYEPVAKFYSWRTELKKRLRSGIRVTEHCAHFVAC